MISHLTPPPLAGRSEDIRCRSRARTTWSVTGADSPRLLRTRRHDCCHGRHTKRRDGRQATCWPARDKVVSRLRHHVSRILRNDTFLRRRRRYPSQSSCRFRSRVRVRSIKVNEGYAEARLRLASDRTFEVLWRGSPSLSSCDQCEVGIESRYVSLRAYDR